METQDELLSHRRSPCRWCQDEGVGGTRLLRIEVELLCLSRRLRARSSDHEDVLESVVIECSSCEMDGAFPFCMREMLCLSIRSLDKNPCDRSLPIWLIEMEVGCTRANQHLSEAKYVRLDRFFV